MTDDTNQTFKPLPHPQVQLIVNGRQDLSRLPWDSTSTEWDPDRLIVLHITTPHLKIQGVKKEGIRV